MSRHSNDITVQGYKSKKINSIDVLYTYSQPNKKCSQSAKSNVIPLFQGTGLSQVGQNNL